MGGSLNYYSKQRFKSGNETELVAAGEYPKCQGLFPDCPASPDLTNSMCRACPKTHWVKKPKLED